MTHKILSLLAVGAVSLIGLGTLSSGPAHARKHCYAGASNGYGWQIQTHGGARRMSTACRRAMRRCKRKLRRAQRRREIPRGSMVPSCRTYGVASQ
jgi:hypothetical protein